MLQTSDTRVHALRLFGVAWAIAIIFDFGSIHRWDRTVYDSLLVFAAFATIFRFGAIGPMVIMAALQGFTVLTRSPWVSNHWVFMGIVSGALVLAYLLLAMRDRRTAIDAGELWDLFAPAGRWCLLILYFYVVFHKLNPDFLDPQASSGALFWRAHADLFPFLPSGDTGALIGAWSTVIIEAAIPILLVFSSTRAAGLVLGLVFHWLVGVSPLGRFWDFSSPIYAMYVLFLPQTVLRFWVAHWPSLQDRAPLAWFWRIPFLLRLVGGIGLAAAALAIVISPLGTYYNTRPFLLFWIIYATAFCAFVIPPLWGAARAEAGRPLFILPKRMLVLAPLLVLFNGLNPYLGLKTESSFAMFSNLRTENGSSNHYLVPASLQIFPYQRQCVQILETDNAQLREVQEEGRLLTLFEFRALAADHPGGFVRFSFEGEEHEMAEFRTNDDLLKRPHPLARRYLRFRPIYADGRSHDWH